MTVNPPPAPPSGVDLQSLFDMIVNGGPVMIPIGLCSVVALTYMVERSLRLRASSLGSRTFGSAVVAALAEGGADRALEVCQRSASSMARVLLPGIKRWGRPTLEREKAVEDAGAREVKRLSANLRPLVVVGAIAPLLGLLGTVWGMIQAFSNIALQDGLGKPELLAAGISQALITTATGLAIAIPSQAAYFYFKSRIDRFVRRAEDVYAEISDLELEQTAGGAA